MASKVKGLDDYLKYLADSPAQMLGGVRRAQSMGAQVVVAQARANCPVALGELQASIHAEPRKATATSARTAIVAGGKAPDGTTINYAHLIEYSGAKPHIITSKTGKLAFGNAVVASVHHPGMRAHPFLRPALDSSETEVVSLVENEVAEILKQG